LEIAHRYLLLDDTFLTIVAKFTVKNWQLS